MSCEDLLNNGLGKLKYEFNSEAVFQEDIDVVFSYSFEQLKEMASKLSFTADIPIPLAEGLINIGTSFAGQKSNFERLKKEYFFSKKEGRFSQNRVSIKAELVNEAAYAAYIQCVKSKGGASGKDVTVDIEQDDERTAVISIRYFPNEPTDPPSITLQDVFVSSNGELVAPTSIDQLIGRRLKIGGAVYFEVKRRDPTLPIFINISAEDRQAVSIQVPGNIPPIVIPPPVDVITYLNGNHTYYVPSNRNSFLGEWANQGKNHPVEAIGALIQSSAIGSDPVSIYFGKTFRNPPAVSVWVRSFTRFGPWTGDGRFPEVSAYKVQAFPDRIELGLGSVYRVQAESVIIGWEASGVI